MVNKKSKDTEEIISGVVDLSRSNQHMPPSLNNCGPAMRYQLTQ